MGGELLGDALGVGGFLDVLQRLDADMGQVVLGAGQVGAGPVLQHGVDAFATDEHQDAHDQRERHQQRRQAQGHQSQVQ